MAWFVRTLMKSVGKKQILALVGLALSGFLALHLAGNLLLLRDLKAFDAYARTLAGSALLLPAEVVLAATFLVHATLGLLVTIENWKARPAPYAIKRWEGGKTWASTTMWITGPLILFFLGIHLANFRFAPKQGRELSELVIATFKSLPYTLGYVAAMCVVALHVGHGFQSAFRSLGLAHPRYTPITLWAGRIFAIAVTLGYGSIALYAHFGRVT